MDDDALPFDRLEPRRPPVSPDCRQGKCRPCSGDAWDDGRDAPCSCACSCHAVGSAGVDPLPFDRLAPRRPPQD